MPIKFIKKGDAPFSLEVYLNEQTERFQPPRSYFNIHASELTREEVEFCPRERALMLLNSKSSKDMYISSALGLTFDIGEEYSTLIREKYLKPIIVGDWKCTHCGTVRKFSRYPNTPCTTCKGKRFSYSEVRFQHPSGADGGIDVILAIPKQTKLVIAEVKSLSKDDFAKLKYPSSEHRVRTCLYLDIIKNSDSPLANQINTEQAHIVYVSKGFGVKGLDGFSPYKSFIINRTDADVTPYHAKAEVLTTFFREGIVPAGICESCSDKRALKCNAKKTCWDTYPAGSITTKLKEAKHGDY